MRRRRSTAFTLVELLVVIGIIVILAGIGIPMGLRAYRNAEVARVRMDLQTIATGLEQYKHDHGDYPRVTSYPTTGTDTQKNYPGGIVLALALVAPADKDTDGADGPGFRVRGTQGAVYGPYIKPESFKMSSDHTSPTAPLDVTSPLLFDKMQKPILYYPASAAKPVLSQPRKFVGNPGDRPLYVYDDNKPLSSAGAVEMTLSKMAILLGDANGDGDIDAGETPKYTGPFLLWTAGADGVYGTEDDITNFNE